MLNSDLELWAERPMSIVEALVLTSLCCCDDFEECRCPSMLRSSVSAVLPDKQRLQHYNSSPLFIACSATMCNARCPTCCSWFHYYTVSITFPSIDVASFHVLPMLDLQPSTGYVLNCSDVICVAFYVPLLENLGFGWI